jgi:putative NADPH-quinone reductase
MASMSQAVNALVILAHPNPASFNHALGTRVLESLQEREIAVHFHDLYAEGFDPVMQLDEYRRKVSFDPNVQGFVRELESSRLLVFIHPDWWGQPPAIMKGWIDRVFRSGVAYEFEGEEFGTKEKVPLLTDRRAMTVITSEAGPLEMDTTVHLWRRHVFEFCGIAEEEILVMPRIRESTHRQRKEFLERIGRRAVELYDAPERLR